MYIRKMFFVLQVNVLREPMKDLALKHLPLKELAIEISLTEWKLCVCDHLARHCATYPYLLVPPVLVWVYNYTNVLSTQWQAKYQLWSKCYATLNSLPCLLLVPATTHTFSNTQSDIVPLLIHPIRFIIPMKFKMQRDITIIIWQTYKWSGSIACLCGCIFVCGPLSL